MLLDVVDIQNSKVGQVEVSDAVFGAEVKPHLHWEMVRYQQAKRRAGTHATKTRGQVARSTRKLYKQKGTGNARHGSNRAPIFVGGGIAHGPHPRDYTMHTPRKVRKGALRSVLSELVRDARLTVVDAWALDNPSTKAAAGVLATLGATKTVVVDVANDNLYKSVRNLGSAKYLQVAGVNVYDLLHYERAVITKEALAQLNGVLEP